MRVLLVMCIAALALVCTSVDLSAYTQCPECFWQYDVCVAFCWASFPWALEECERLCFYDYRLCVAACRRIAPNLVPPAEELTALTRGGLLKWKWVVV